MAFIIPCARLESIIPTNGNISMFFHISVQHQAGHCLMSGIKWMLKLGFYRQLPESVDRRAAFASSTMRATSASSSFAS